MSGKRGFGFLVTALALLAVPILAGSFRRNAEETDEMPTGEGRKNEVASEPVGSAKEDAPVTAGAAVDPGPVVRAAIKLSAPSVTQAGYRMGSVAKDPDAKAYQEQLRREQEQMIRRIEERLGHSIEVKQRMTLTTNVISANVYLTDLDLIRSVDGVVSVSEETRHEPTAGAPAARGKTARA